jgi:hypothetical protein
MLATIKAVGIVQPPLVAPETDGGNGSIIDAGHRHVRLAISAGLEDSEILVVDAANDNPGSWAPCAPWSRTALVSRSTLRINGGASNIWLLWGGPRKRLLSLSLSGSSDPQAAPARQRPADHARTDGAGRHAVRTPATDHIRSRSGAPEGGLEGAQAEEERRGSVVADHQCTHHFIVSCYSRSCGLRHILVAGPPEFCAITPHPMYDHRKPPCQRNNGLSHAKRLATFIA